MLAVAGGAAGLAVGSLTLRLLMTWWGGDAQDSFEAAGLNGPVLWFGVGLSILTGFLFGLYPAWMASRVSAAATLSDESAKSSASKGASRLRRALGRVDTVVVHDPYWTAMAKHADIVVPSTTAFERDDYSGSRNDPTFMAMPKLTEPYAKSRDDYTTFAALADAHFVVDKHEARGRTHTTVRKLDPRERVDEIARMIGGIKVGDAARKAAAELLANRSS